MRIVALLLMCGVAACAAPGSGRLQSSGPVPGLAGLAAGLEAEVTALAAGVSYGRVADPTGPWAVHVVEVEMARCRPVLEVRMPTGRLSEVATTTSLSTGTLAAVNADFFRVPGGTPVGAHVHAGVAAAGPTEWPVFAVDDAGGVVFGRGRLDGFVAVAGDSARLWQLNRQATSFTAYPGTTGGVALHTSRADSLPADSAALRITLRVLDGDEAAGRGVVLFTEAPAPATFVVDGQAVLLARGTAREWGERRTQGDTVTWQARVLVDDGSGAPVTAREAVGGFPALLVGGRNVLGLQSVRPAFGEARHPRTAVGWTADGARVFLVVVDGRQEHSDGMTLPELVHLFRRLGAAEALNLDGGGSTAMTVRGRLVNSPSDEDGEREVANVLALTRCG